MQKIQETRLRSLSQEDPLEKEMTTYSNILAWEIPWTEEPDGLQSIQQLSMHTNNTYYSIVYIPLLVDVYVACGFHVLAIVQMVLQ